MSYNDYEQAIATGHPVECYDIAMGSTHWRLTPGPDDISYGGYTYSHAKCKRTQIEQTSEIPKDTVELELPRNHEFVSIITQATPESEISLTIYRGHDSYFVTFWRGYMTSISVDENNIPKCRFAPLSSDLPSVGMRRPIQRACPHILYGTGSGQCKANSNNFKVTGVIDSFNGLTLTSTTFGEALWNNRTVSSGQNIAYDDLTSLTGCVYNGNNTGENSTSYDYAFDNRVGAPTWFSGQLGGAWISCQWTSQIIINRVRIQPCPDVNTPYYKWAPLYVMLAGSDNGTDWTNLEITSFIENCSAYAAVTIGSITASVSDSGLHPYIALLDLQRSYSSWAEFEVDNSTAYYYYRIYCIAPWFKAYNSTTYILENGGDYGIGIGEIEMTNTNNETGDYPELTNGLGAGGLIVIGDVERAIIAHSGDNITIDRYIPGLQVGASFTAYAGCDHTAVTCRSKFDNILNYGGFEFLPVANPYKSNIYY